MTITNRILPFGSDRFIFGKGISIRAAFFAEMFRDRVGRQLAFLHREKDTEGENRIGELMRVTDADKALPGVIGRRIVSNW